MASRAGATPGVTTAHSVDRIATQVGFGSPTAFRDRFKRQVGTSPHAYRRAFQGSSVGVSPVSGSVPA
jgi:transcriptional regulator GlxA family with amidase domain